MSYQYVAPLSPWARTFLGPEVTEYLRGKPIQVIGASPKGPWTVRGPGYEKYAVPSTELVVTIAEALAALEVTHA